MAAAYETPALKSVINFLITADERLLRLATNQHVDRSEGRLMAEVSEKRPTRHKNAPSRSETAFVSQSEAPRVEPERPKLVPACTGREAGQTDRRSVTDGDGGARLLGVPIRHFDGGFGLFFLCYRSERYERVRPSQKANVTRSLLEDSRVVKNDFPSTSKQKE